MKDFKILLTRSLLEVDRKYINDSLSMKIGGKFQIVSPNTYDEEGICKEITDADILLGPFVTEKILENAKRLKLIQVPWTGMDTFDFDVVKNSIVPVCNSHSNADAVAEMALGLVLDLVKKISYHDRKMRFGNWNRDQVPLNLKSRMLSDMTVCILGYGKIGRKIGKLLSAFGTNVIGVANHLYDYDEADEMYLSSNWLHAVSKADICICTLPLTEKTNGQINFETIKFLKQGCIIINMSRAEIFEEDAIYNALIQGRVSGFASDVWWNTPKRGESKSFVSKYNKFEKLDNVVLSPHRAGFIEGAFPHLDDAIKNIINIAEGKPLINIVDISSRY